MDHASNPTANPPSRDSIPSSGVEPLRNGDSFDEDWGDFVDSEDKFDIEAVSKDANLYPRGICYRIQIGEVLASRYRILHKLGHGSFLTVWMRRRPKNLTLGDSEDREYCMQSEIVRAV
ncbi:hypothetical protein NW769_013340 [Fusarium oxysporum]|nr:hypothetical protein NW769_013340 [Fusarium oxysporum]